MEEHAGSRQSGVEVLRLREWLSCSCPAQLTQNLRGHKGDNPGGNKDVMRW